MSKEISLNQKNYGVYEFTPKQNGKIFLRGMGKGVEEGDTLCDNVFLRMEDKPVSVVVEKVIYRDHKGNFTNEELAKENYFVAECSIA